MAGFRGFKSDVSGRVIQPGEHVRLRVTAKRADGTLHEGQIDVLWEEVEGLLPALESGEKMTLKVGAKRGRKPSSTPEG